MSNSVSHGSLPYPIKNARFTVLIPYLDADGDPTDPTTPDTEISQDGGAFADAAEEMTTISGSNGMGYITLSGAETNNSLVALAAKVASGPKATLATLYPRNLPILASGTASAGASGTITLASSITYDITGCFVRTTGGTGGGGTGGANNQARRITAYNSGTQVATVTPNWETTPSSDTTYDILLPEGVTIQMVKALNPTTAGRTLDVSSGGEAGLDWANIGSPTTTVGLSGTTVKTATDVETDTQDIQLRLPAALGANGNIKADVRDFNGTAGTFSSGRPEVNTTLIEGSDATNQIRDSIVDDATRIDASALNTLSGHDPGGTLASDGSQTTIINATNTIIGQTDVLRFFVIAQDDIGSTGNDTTHVHLPSLGYGDDEINGYMLVIYDDSAAEYHWRKITAWVNSTKLATVATLPFTPENGVDDFALLSSLADASVTGGDATAANQTAILAAISGLNDISATDVWAAGTRTLSSAANITSTGGTITVSSGGVFLGDGAHGGTAATFTGKKAVIIATDSNTDALALFGNGTGTGINAASLGTGHGMSLTGGISGGIGLNILGTTSNQGVKITGGSTDGTALDIIGQNNGKGVRIYSPGSAAALTVDGAGAGADIDADVSGNLSGSVGSLATQAKADVNAEVVDALATDTYAEPGQGTPAATASLAAKINYLFKAWRNKKSLNKDTGQLSIYADDATTVDQKATVTDDGTTATEGEIASGP